MVPAGWAPCWDSTYKRFYFINLATKYSQWELPTADEAQAPLDPPCPPPYEVILDPLDRGPTNDPVHSQTQRMSEAEEEFPKRSNSRSGGLGAKISKFLRTRSPSMAHAHSRPAQNHDIPPPTQYSGGVPPQNLESVDEAKPLGGLALPQKKPGIGVAEGVGMGMGAGLLGGVLVADAVEDHDGGFDYIEARGWDDGAGGDECEFGTAF